MRRGKRKGTVFINIRALFQAAVYHNRFVLGQRDANPAAASIIMSLESVFGVVGAALLLGERMTPREYLGAAIVLAAVLLSQLDLDTIRKSFKK